MNEKNKKWYYKILSKSQQAKEINGEMAAVSLGYVYSLIDEMLEDFNSKICDNCIYYKYYSDSETSCHNREVAIYYPEKTYGCNKWEQKL